MATTLSSSLFAISASSSSAAKACNFKRSVSLYSKTHLLHYNPLSLRTSIFRVQATLLQDNEEKLSVEESVLSKTSLDDTSKGSSGDPTGSSSSSAVEKWVIKFEQSLNIFLTLHYGFQFSGFCDKVLDAFYLDRLYARFLVLETIARVPYFAFISVLHLYESFGCWRRADYLKVHFAESWNEMHHLLIMEIIFLNVYRVMQLKHMTNLSRSKEDLKKKPAPAVAVNYYTGGEFQTSRAPNTRRPKIENLNDVFVNIRDDEAEHCKAMKACQTHGNLRSPHSYLENAFEDDSACTLQADCEGIVGCIKKSVTSDPAEPKQGIEQ